MKLKIYQVDAFSDQVFGGNPAAVVPLTSWLEDGLMQKIAMENNLSETAFVLPKGNGFEIRWFTPEVEVDLCGHATLAAAHVLFNHEGFRGTEIVFHSKNSGELKVVHETGLLTLNFPADEIKEVETPLDVHSYFSFKPLATCKGKTDYLFLFQLEKEVRDCKVNFQEMAKLDARGVIITAKGEQHDFVSRFFAPQVGVPEDPVTGSAHTTLTLFWSKMLGKSKMLAAQLSQRGGELTCTLEKDRVLISGKARTYLIGEIFTE